MTSVVFLLGVLVILSVNGVKVYNKVKQEENYTGDGGTTSTTHVQDYDVM